MRCRVRHAIASEKTVLVVDADMVLGLKTGYRDPWLVLVVWANAGDRSADHFFTASKSRARRKPFGDRHSTEFRSNPTSFRLE
jgi:hypothetical protein